MKYFNASKLVARLTIYLSQAVGCFGSLVSPASKTMHSSGSGNPGSHSELFVRTDAEIVCIHRLATIQNYYSNAREAASNVFDI